MEILSITSGNSLDNILLIILRRVEDNDILLDVKNNYLDVVLSFLEKNYIIYNIREKTELYTRLTLTIPERYLLLHPRIDFLSKRILDPTLFRKLVSYGTPKEHGVILDPRELLRYLRSLTLLNENYLVVMRSEKGLRSAILIIEGRIAGIWTHTIFHETGRRALRQLMWYGPYRFLTLKIPRKT